MTERVSDLSEYGSLELIYNLLDAIQLLTTKIKSSVFQGIIISNGIHL